MSGFTIVAGQVYVSQNPAGTVIRQSADVSLSDLQGVGAAASGTFSVGAALPANARILGAEVNSTQVPNAVGLTTAIATVQGSGDSAGSLVAPVSLLTTGLKSLAGVNPYVSRGSQQVTVTVTLGVALLNALSAGALTVNLFYVVVS